jgi:hypothetical protein
MTIGDYISPVNGNYGEDQKNFPWPMLTHPTNIVYYRLMMKTVPDLIAAFGGPTAFAELVGLKRVSNATEMKRNRSIAAWHWPRVIAAAQEIGLKGVTAESLMRIHSHKADR